MTISIYKKAVLFSLFSVAAMPITADEGGYFARLKHRLSNFSKPKSLKVISKPKSKISIGSKIIVGGIVLVGTYLAYKGYTWLINRNKNVKVQKNTTGRLNDQAPKEDSSPEYPDVTEKVTSGVEVITENNQTGDEALTKLLSSNDESDVPSNQDTSLISVLNSHNKLTKKQKSFSRPRRPRRTSTSVKQAKAHIKKKSKEPTNNSTTTTARKSDKKPVGAKGFGMLGGLQNAIKASQKRRKK